jgi:ubiquinone/menaquinone biosynthesis C-methylase UbiE
MEEAVRVAAKGSYSRCIGLDPQLGMLRRGARGSVTADRVRGTGSQIPLADGSAEVVLSLGVLCCMQGSDVSRAVSELWRIARPCGYCLLGVPRGWHATTDPLFRAVGFGHVAQPRPGRALYQRPLVSTQPSDRNDGFSPTGSE